MKIGEMMKAWRTIKDIELRDLSRRIGVSAPTLMRLEKGKQISTRTLNKIMYWIMRQEE